MSRAVFKKIYPSVFLLSVSVAISCFVSVAVTQVLVPVIWDMPVHTVQILNPADRPVHDIDIPVYMTFMGALLVSFAVFSAFFFFYRTKQWFMTVMTTIPTIGFLYVLVYPGFNLTSIPVGLPFLLIVFAAVLVQVLWIRRPIPESVFMIVATYVVLKMFTGSVLQFDIGADSGRGWWLHYIYVCGVALLYILWHWFARKYQRLAQAIRPVLRIAVPVIGGMIIVLTILRLMLIYEDGWDMNFTLMPAYHILRGGVPFVDVVSQYGYLYLAPWIFWMALFPGLPVSYPMGIWTTALFLIGYFVLLLYLCRKLFRSTFIVLVTTLSCLFYTVLIRYVGFPSYKISLISHPMFTPLRFGVFIVPLLFLVFFIRTKRPVWMGWFIAASVLGLFFSFEIGVGLVAAAASVVVVWAAASNRAVSVLKTHLLTAVLVLAGSLIVVCGYTLLRSSTLPDLMTYVFYAAAFGSGYYMNPVGGDVAYQFPLFLTAIAAFVGGMLVFRDDDGQGIIALYLSVIGLALFPYYFGRSNQMTLYSISLPVLLLAGLGADAVAYRQEILKRHIAAAAICGLMCVFLLSGSIRSIILAAETGIQTGEVFRESSVFVRTAFTQWDVLQTPQYAFLARALPADCPLVSMDGGESDLLAALHATPAFAYSFLQGTIHAQEQIDGLRPKLPFCLFINQRVYDAYDGRFTYVYRAVWQKAESAAQLLAQDDMQGFRLYRVSAWK